MNRRYFILNKPSLEELKALEMCIGAMDTQRYSLDFTKILIKTTQKLIDLHITDIGTLGTEYTYEEIIVILQSSEWKNEDII